MQGNDGYTGVSDFVTKVNQLVGMDITIGSRALELRSAGFGLSGKPDLCVAIACAERHSKEIFREIKDSTCQGSGNSLQSLEPIRIALFGGETQELIRCSKPKQINGRHYCGDTEKLCKYSGGYTSK